jgi:hypothetical protein
MVMDCINEGNFQPYFWSQRKLRLQRIVKNYD